MPAEESAPKKREHVHEFRCRLIWTGAERGGTTSYAAYSREYRIEMPNKAPFAGSAAAAFRGDATLPNPEDLLVASLSACHCLTYLALCARASIVVVGYEDDAWGKLEPFGRSLKFTEAVLRPRVTISDREQLRKAIELHEEAHQSCFIANSVNFPVRNEPTVSVVAGE